MHFIEAQLSHDRLGLNILERLLMTSTKRWMLSCARPPVQVLWWSFATASPVKFLTWEKLSFQEYAWRQIGYLCFTISFLRLLQVASLGHVYGTKKWLTCVQTLANSFVTLTSLASYLRFAEHYIYSLPTLNSQSADYCGGGFPPPPPCPFMPACGVRTGSEQIACWLSAFNEDC